MVALNVLLGLLVAFIATAVPVLGFVDGVRFALVQFVSLLATAVGWVLLAPLCLFHLWSKADTVGIKTVPSNWKVDKWLLPINAVYGNPEDGVSGQQALVWDAGKQVPYMPSPEVPGTIQAWLFDAWRAYCWSAGRNSSDGLKYVFAYPGGPLKSGSFKIFGKTITYTMGWQRENGKFLVPAFSVS